MIRKIVQIDEEKCMGCGLCASACHENAIQMEGGKARLIKDDYCDGLGDCLPACPTDAITIIEREAADYDAEAVAARQEALRSDEDAWDAAGFEAGRGSLDFEPEEEEPMGCPGSRVRNLVRTPVQPAMGCPGSAPRAVGIAGAGAAAGVVAAQAAPMQSELRQWPVQIQLVPTKAPFYENANLLIAADCTAYAYANFHSEFLKNHVLLIGCPKLDPVDYAEKLMAILNQNNIKSVHIVRMEVPCCGGIEMAAQRAMQMSGKWLPWRVTTISIDGEIIDET